MAAMSVATFKRQFAGLLMHLVLAVRGTVLHQPAARSALRAVGRPVIRLAMRMEKTGRAPPRMPWRGVEPVLRLPLDYAPGPLSPAPRLCVLFHAGDREATNAYAAALQRLELAADLLVTTSGAPEAFARTLARDWRGGAAETRTAAGGLGEQLAAFADRLQAYDLVLRIPAEAAPAGSPDAAQRELILATFLGSQLQVRGVLEAFVQASRLGLMAARTSRQLRSHTGWGGRYAAARQAAEDLGFALFADSSTDSPAGGVFWARPAALTPLIGAPMVAERLVLHACERAGYRWGRAGDDRRPAAPEIFFKADTPRALERTVTDCGRAVLPPRRPAQPAVTKAASPAVRKEAFRAACRQELDAFLESGERLVLPTSAQPVVSIVLLLFNQAELTFQCLRSLKFALDAPCEIIIADNASSDRTSELLDRIDGARIIRNAENLHFVRGINAASAHARGRHLLMLNNDTRVTPGSIAAAAGLLEADQTVGAVGGRIELLDGTLQEAGSIIWSDGSCAGFGRGEDPNAPEFQFRRDVDYCSGAFLMVRRDLFEILSRLDEAFAPAYYEETDLCMRIRAAGSRVVYEPRVHVSHFEFGSAASSDAAIALQVGHQAVFANRHAKVLASAHAAPGANLLAARMRPRHAGRVLVLDDQAPFPHLGAGYPRALDILQAVSAAGWFVTLFPMTYPDVDLEAAYAILPREVEIAAELGRERLTAFMKERTGFYDAVIVSRPHNMELFRAALSQVPEFVALGHVLYDAEAIFALRGDLGRGGDPAALKQELALAEGVACVLAVNAAEARSFADQGVGAVEVVGHALAAQPSTRPFESRRDLLFVGAVDADGSPNADSLVFFVQEVMPRLDALIGDDYLLRVAGRPGSAEVRALAGPRVQLLGRIDDLQPLYDASRLFVAPTRFAAGIPMKVHSAAAAGLPAVVTPLLAGQLGWEDGQDVVVGDGAQGFAEACARLYRDPALWSQVRAGALGRIAAECAPDAFNARVRGALEAVRRPQAASSSSSLRMSVTEEATPPSRRMTLLQ